MKEWFKYEYGYVNIDSQNLYLTHTGNWSEIPSLTEKPKRKNTVRSYMIKAYLAIVLISFTLIILNMMSKVEVGLLALLHLGVVGYVLYEYLKRETGYKFFIPLRKIRSIEYSDANVRIEFRNKENDEESILLDKVEVKGILLLKKMEELADANSRGIKSQLATSQSGQNIEETIQ